MFDETTKLATKAVSNGTLEAEEPQYEDIVLDIPLLEVLQNYTMQLAVAAFLPHKVIEALENVGPEQDSSLLLSQIIATVDKLVISTADKKPLKEQVIWAAGNNSKQPAPNNLNKSNKHNAACTNCGNDGHDRRECKFCAFCKRPGHTTKACKLRLKEVTGKYCEICKRRDSHVADDCYKNPKNKKQRQKHNVRLAQNSNAADGDDWASPDFNYDSNDSPEQPSTSHC